MMLKVTNALKEAKWPKSKILHISFINTHSNKHSLPAVYFSFKTGLTKMIESIQKTNMLLVTAAEALVVKGIVIMIAKEAQVGLSKVNMTVEIPQMIKMAGVDTAKRNRAIMERAEVKALARKSNTEVGAEA